MQGATINRHPISSRAAAITESVEPPPPMLAHATLVATPLTWDAPEAIGPSVHWSGGKELRKEAGPCHEAGLWVRSRLAGAGPGFAYAEVLGLRIGPLFASRLTVVCAGGVAAFQIEGGGGGSRLTAGSRMTVDDLQIEAGTTEHHGDGTVTATGLKIAMPNGPVIYIAVARAGRLAPLRAERT
jgi:hypothetical protein